MRQFKLKNKAGTISFDFKANKIIITEVAGLGSSFDVTINEGVVTNYQKGFENITLTANYGVGGNAYTAYTNMAKFIEENLGESLQLEYSVNNRTVYADVMLKSIPKSQKTGFGVLVEQIVLVRLTYWYILEQITISNGGVPISNALNTPIELVITVESGSDEGFSIQLLKDIEEISEIKARFSIPVTYKIDGANKKIEALNGTNLYNMFDKTKDSFMIIPKGNYTIKQTGAAGGVTASFKKWVVD